MIKHGNSLLELSNSKMLKPGEFTTAIMNVECVRFNMNIDDAISLPNIKDLSQFCNRMGNFKNAPLWPNFGVRGQARATPRRWQRISPRVYCSRPNRRLSIYFSMNTLLPARPRLSKFICSVWFTLYRCLFVITAPECFIAGAGLKSRTTPLFFAIFPRSFQDFNFILCLFSCCRSRTPC